MRLYELKNVKKYYGDLLAVDISSLSLNKGSFYTVYGPNASGKSTLLNLLSFLDKPSEGEVFFTPLEGRGLLTGFNNGGQVSFVMQHPYLFNTSVFKNVCYGLLVRSVEKEKIEHIVSPVMQRLGIWKLKDRNANLLSGGEKRKVAIARALVLDTEVLLLDEPTAHLDKGHIGLIEDIICSAAVNPRKTIIMATHNLNQAQRLTDNIIHLSEGKDRL